MTREQIIEKCAEAAYEINRIYCEANGDFTQSQWNSAPEWQRNSSINGVTVVLNGSTPEQQHEAWMQDKINAGWKYGPVKDVDKKESPCMVPYDQLPKMQQIKDSLYINTVLNMFAALGQ